MLHGREDEVASSARRDEMRRDCRGVKTDGTAVCVVQVPRLQVLVQLTHVTRPSSVQAVSVITRSPRTGSTMAGSEDDSQLRSIAASHLIPDNSRRVRGVVAVE